MQTSECLTALNFSFCNVKQLIEIKMGCFSDMGYLRVYGNKACGGSTLHQRGQRTHRVEIFSRSATEECAKMLALFFCNLSMDLPQHRNDTKLFKKKLTLDRSLFVLLRKWQTKLH